MSCYNTKKDWVYHSLEELMNDKSLTDEERREIMTKSKTTVRVDATHQKTVWVRSNDSQRNRYRSNGSNSSRNTNGNDYNNK